MPLFSSSAWTVSDLNRYVRELFESDYNLQDVWVEGEISNFSRPRSGHIYFTLKDAQASLRGVMWRSYAQKQIVTPHSGDAVLVHGKISVYEAGGQYQLYADRIQPLGEGALFQAFLRLKTQLEAEGLFDPLRKQQIPESPRRIGIVTSATGAALRDMLNTLQRRYPLVEVILSPSPVQGVAAPPGLVAALEALQRLSPAPDVILMARGGGSLEDLWAFNDARVVRAVAACPIPIISGVGHETDFTLADFAADLRAPTPTAAAELAVPDRADLLGMLADRVNRIQHSLDLLLSEEHHRITVLSEGIQRLSPANRIRSEQQRIDELLLRAQTGQAHFLEIQHMHLQNNRQRLEALNPLAVLQRGFVVVHNAQGEQLRSVTQVTPGEKINLRLQDGELDAQVTGKK